MESKDSDQTRLVAVIGDEDTVTGFLLAGVGQRTVKGNNYVVVDSSTAVPAIEEAFTKFTGRSDIGIVLINQHVANEIRPLLSAYKKVLPVVVEIPSKDAPYDASKDPTMTRILKMLGEA